MNETIENFELMTQEQIVAMPASDVPLAVDQCVGNLKAIQTKVTMAIKNAEKAKGLAKTARDIELHWYKIGDKAAAIEALQKSMVGVAGAQSDQAEAVKQLLVYQETVAKGMKFLLALGVANVVNSRTVVKRLELQLRNASEEEIGEMAQNEIRAVIAQVKAQLDLHERQNRLSIDQKKVKERLSATERWINELSRHEEELNRKIEEGIDVDAEQDREIARQAKKDKEHDTELRRQAEKDREHDDRLQHLAETDTQLKSRVNENAARIAFNTKAVSENAKSVVVNAEGIAQNAQAIDGVRKALKAQRHAIAGTIYGASMFKFALWLSVAALLISLVTFVLFIGHIYK